ncbi:MAG: hypothetical protein M3133_04330 [Actinomycetota bacterium]|nr:hypothetical protein [Actinomycetota bacterium]
MLGELESDGGIVICDLEAGVGTILRMEADQADVVLVVADPSAKSIEVARRAAEIASQHARVIVLANRLRDEADLEAVRSVLGGHEIVAVPDDPAIARADQDGTAPIDVDPDSPGVRALVGLAERLAGERPSAS